MNGCLGQDPKQTLWSVRPRPTSSAQQERRSCWKFILQINLSCHFCFCSELIAGNQSEDGTLVHRFHTDACSTKGPRIKLGRGFTEKGLTESSRRWRTVWCVYSMWLLEVCVFFSFETWSHLCSLACPRTRSIRLASIQIHRDLLASTLLDTLDQCSRKRDFGWITLVIRVEPLLTVSEIGIFGVIDGCL